MSFTITNKTGIKIDFIMISFRFRDSATGPGRWSEGGDHISKPFNKGSVLTLDSSNMREEYFESDVTIGNLTQIIYKTENEDIYLHECNSRNETLDITVDQKKEK